MECGNTAFYPVYPVYPVHPCSTASGANPFPRSVRGARVLRGQLPAGEGWAAADLRRKRAMIRQTSQGANQTRFQVTTVNL